MAPWKQDDRFYLHGPGQHVRGLCFGALGLVMKATLTRTAGAAWLAVIVCMFSASPAGAQSPYHLTSNKEWILLGAGASTTLTGVLLVNQVKPYTESELAGLDPGNINSFDRAALNPYREDLAGNALNLASFALPFTLLADSRTRTDWKTLGAMWGEVLLLQSGVTAMTKGLVECARPYAYDVNAPVEVRSDRRAKMSFISGHTSSTAAICFFLATVYSDYPFSRTTKTIAWTTAAIYPALVGFYRVDSGHHFRTDVIAGYLAGAAIGCLVPALHRQRPGENAPVGVSGSSGQLRFVFNF